MLQLLCATQNLGKQVEIRTALEKAGISVFVPSDYPDLLAFDPEETGATFHENAAIKARAFGERAGILTLAEDAGLEVHALGGKPGVHSKRFFPGSDVDRNTELLRLLTGVSDRTAQFRAVMCLYQPTPARETFFEGVVNGQIALQPQGTSGFGYDPIFIPDGYTQSFAELGIEIKNNLSHRGQALAQALSFLVQDMTP